MFGSAYIYARTDSYIGIDIARGAYVYSCARMRICVCLHIDFSLTVACADTWHMHSCMCMQVCTHILFDMDIRTRTYTRALTRAYQQCDTQPLDQQRPQAPPFAAETVIGSETAKLAGRSISSSTRIGVRDIIISRPSNNLHCYHHHHHHHHFHHQYQ